MNNKPIGVFDSGLGGLTAVKELLKVLPYENIIYFETPDVFLMAIKAAKLY